MRVKLEQASKAAMWTPTRSRTGLFPIRSAFQDASASPLRARGVISPALANLYRNRMLKGWRQTKRGEQFRAQIVNHADDFVILSRGRAKEALEWTRSVLERLKLTLNEKKTSLRNACREHFDFLSYTFGPHYSMRTGREYIGNSPSMKSVARIKEKVGDLLVPSNVAPWEEVCERLNRKLRGWRAYFGRGATAKAYRAVDAHVYDCVRHFLRRRHQVSSQGTCQFPEERVFGSLGVARLQGPMGARSLSLRMKPVGKPDAGNPPVRFDERGWETGRAMLLAPAPILDATGAWPAVSRIPRPAPLRARPLESANNRAISEAPTLSSEQLGNI
jgi:Group II intron, maturase-specific domain/Reverse transcriptase (RNA-dependent DNA polymerase)